MRSVVMAPNWVGDTVMALPVIEALAAADREVHVLAKPHLQSLLELSDAVNGVVVRGDDRETVSRLQEARFDEAVLLPNSFRSAWLLKKAGIPYRWGYRGEFRTPILNPPVQRPKQKKRHQIEDYAELLDAMGVPSPASWVPKLPLDESTRSAAAERIERAGIDPHEGVRVGLFAGAEFGPSKRWPWRRFAELTKVLRRRRPNLSQIFIAGPQELWLSVRLFEESGNIHPVIGPDLDLAGLAGVLERLDVLVTNDSGPMHLAAAVGTPTVALFGPTNPVRTAPSGDGHQVLATNRWCAPCFKRRCPLLHHGCLRDFSIEQVADRCEAVLNERPPQPIVIPAAE